MLSRKGVTLIELVTGLVIIGIIATAVNTYLLGRQMGTLKQEKLNLIRDVIKQNVAEIHGKGLNTKPPLVYPPEGECLTRLYDVNGLFISQNPTGHPWGNAISSADCSDPYSSEPGRIKIVMKFYPVLASSLTFTPSQFLKLPASSASFVEIDISGTYTPPKGTAGAPQTLSITKRRWDD